MNSFAALMAFCLVAVASATTPEKCNDCTKTNVAVTNLPDCGDTMETCSDGQWCKSVNETTKKDDGTWEMDYSSECATPSDSQTEACTSASDDSDTSKTRTCWCKTAMCVDPMYQSGAGMVAGFTLATLASVILAKIL